MEYSLGEKNGLEENNIIFQVEGKEVLKLGKDGNIYVRGKLVENDIEVVEGLREFLKGNR